MIKDIEEKILNKEFLTQEEINCFLNYIVSSVKEIVNDDNFINKCDLVQGLVGRYLNRLEIPNYPSLTNKCIMPNVVGHSFIVATINNINYIIDPTFIQFACMEFDDLYLNHFRVKSKSPFYYASIINKEKTISLISKGYLELNEETAYFYGNSFYYTLTNIKDDYVFKSINGNTFINSFLKGNEVLRNYDCEEIKTSFNKKNLI